MIALLGALKEEIACLRNKMKVSKTVSGAACAVYRGTLNGREILLVQTGMGKQRVQAATRHLVDHYPITQILSLGFAGALTNAPRAGDVVVYSAVYCSDTRGSQQEAYASSDSLLATARAALEGMACNVICTSGVSVPHPVLSSEAKEALASRFHATVVDMESYWIAEIASERQIPFAVIRSVSDTKHEKMLPFEQMMSEDGAVLWWKAVGHFLRRPHHLLIANRLYRNAKLAAANLAIAIDKLIVAL